MNASDILIITHGYSTSQLITSGTLTQYFINCIGYRAIELISDMIRVLSN